MMLGKTLAVIDAGREARLHVGVQLFVAHKGETVADLGIGLAAEGRPMTPNSMMTWLSTSKIATSILFAQLWEDGLVRLDDPVAAHVPSSACAARKPSLCAKSGPTPARCCTSRTNYSRCAIASRTPRTSR